MFAVIVPYRNRRRFVDLFLQTIPVYLHESGHINYHIFVAEQVGSGPFALATSRNVGARAAQDHGQYDYYVFHDVDILPVRNIDYGPPALSTVWFMNAGSAKLPSSIFHAVNGYNNSFIGWGFEDTEFWHRLHIFGHPTQEWHKTHEAKQAEMLNLECQLESEEELMRFSQHYFGFAEDVGPRFVQNSLCSPESPGFDKTQDFYIETLVTRNKRLLDWIRKLPTAIAQEYFLLHGINAINPATMSLLYRTEKVSWVQYNRSDVLT